MTVRTTAASVSQTIRSRSSSATCRARSARTSSSPAARLTPSRRISSTRAFETRCSAASIAPKIPARGIRQMAITRKVIEPALIGCGSSRPRLPDHRRTGDGFARRGLPALEELLLEAEHLLLLVGLHVVVTEEVEDAVGGQQDQLVVHRVAGGAGLPDGDRRAEDD